MPPEDLSWASSSDVTLIGDAAHATTPFVGEGANIALRDALVLSQKLEQYGVTQKAISEYERDMFPYAADVIQRSNAVGQVVFDRDDLVAYKEMMIGHSPLLQL